MTNDSDVDLDALSVLSNTDPANGTVTIAATGEFTYTPNAGFEGDDSFEYTISDGNGGEATATVSITVAAKPNTAPVAVADEFSTEFETPAVGNVLTNDSDVDLDALSVLSNTDPANGTVTIAATGEFTYTPNAGFEGSDSFEYTISDGNGGEATATVSITVARSRTQLPLLWRTNSPPSLKHRLLATY